MLSAKQGANNKTGTSRKAAAFVALAILVICAVPIWIDQRGKINNYNLLSASASGDWQAVEKLLLNGADVNQRFGGDGETPLHRAATQGQMKIVELLLREHADPNIGDADGATPLFSASYKGHTEIVKLLLKSGADPNKAENRYGMTPLIVAAWKGHASTVQMLLDGGADSSKAAKDGNTALSKARSEDHSEILQLLNQSKK